jgi:hypothetical protein
MPRHPVVNGRNLSPFVRKLVSVTEEAYDQAAQLAAALEVSTGSIVDTALRQLAGTDPGEVLELLRAHGHLTDAEYAYVRERAASGTSSATVSISRGASTRRAASPADRKRASGTKTGRTKQGATSKQTRGRPA